MTLDQLYDRICEKGSMLCVGLDSELEKLPESLRLECRRGDMALGGSLYSGDARAQMTFNRRIIDATAKYAVAYKPNLAFYESLGSEGLKVLEGTVRYIRERHPDIFLIADAKRGDIGNTARLYAKTFFERMDFDAVTLSPYMGTDTVKPFLEYEGKYAIVVALSSNPSATDYQGWTQDGTPMWRRVMESMMEISSPDNMMFVVGATRAEHLSQVRSFCPDNFLLVPGVGAQGGSAEEVIRYGANSRGGLLINSSRGVIFASSGEDYAEAAAMAASQTARFTPPA